MWLAAVAIDRSIHIVAKLVSGQGEEWGDGGLCVALALRGLLCAAEDVGGERADRDSFSVLCASLQILKH